MYVVGELYVLSEITQTQKYKYYMISFSVESKLVKLRSREWNGGLQGAVVMEKWEVTIKEHKVSVLQDKFWRPYI